MYEHEELRLSSYLDFEDFQRTCPGLLLVAFVNRNEPLARQLQALRYLRGKHPSLPVFILPSGYCDPQRVKYNIASFPTFIFIRQGREVGRFVGRVTGRDLEDFLLDAAGGGVRQGGNRVATNRKLPLQ